MTIETMNSNLDYLDVLLKDIYEYLKKRQENPTISNDDRQLAENLMDRSKKQLQKFAISKTKEHKEHNQDDRYVDMSKNSNEPPPQLPVKKPVHPPQSTPPPSSERKCPYKDIPAKQIPNDVKHGTLSLRKKMFNIIGHSSKVFGAIHENWLLIYGSSKDAKTLDALDLSKYEAKEDDFDPTITELDITRDGGFKRNSKKMASSFKVFQSVSPDKKCYSFVATTHKDMQQWVVHINRSHDKAVRESKGLEDIVYDYCQNPQDIADDENIYNEVDMPQFKPPVIKNNREITSKPSIPRSLPDIPTRHSSLSSNEEIYQELEPIKETVSVASIMTDDSFDKEDEEEEETYYELDGIRKETQNLALKQEEKHAEDEENKESNSASPSLLPKQNDKIKANKYETVNKKDMNDEIVEEESKQKNLSEKGSLKQVRKILSNKSISGLKSIPSKKEILKNTNIKNTPSVTTIIKTPDLPLKKDSLKIDLSSINTPKKIAVTTELNLTTLISDSLPVKESSTITIRDSFDSHKPTPKSNHSIVKIIRQRFSTMESQNRNLETFSRNSKLETFQASVSRDSTIIDDFMVDSKAEIEDLNNSPVKPVNSKTSKKLDVDNEKPMVQLKPNLEDEVSDNKSKKSPNHQLNQKKLLRSYHFRAT